MIHTIFSPETESTFAIVPGILFSVLVSSTLRQFRVNYNKTNNAI